MSRKTRWVAELLLPGRHRNSVFIVAQFNSLPPTDSMAAFQKYKRISGHSDIIRRRCRRNSSLNCRWSRTGFSQRSRIFTRYGKATAANQADLAFLPSMITDVTLRSTKRTITIDAKYYKD